MSEHGSPSHVFITNTPGSGVALKTLLSAGHFIIAICNNQGHETWMQREMMTYVMSELRKGKTALHPTNLDERIASLEPDRLTWAKSLKAQAQDKANPKATPKAPTPAMLETPSKQTPDEKKRDPETPDANPEASKVQKIGEAQGGSPALAVQQVSPDSKSMSNCRAMS